MRQIEAPRRKRAEMSTVFRFCFWVFCCLMMILILVVSETAHHLHFCFQFSCKTNFRFDYCILSAPHRRAAANVFENKCCFSVSRFGIVACDDRIKWMLSEAMCHLHFCFDYFCLIILTRSIKCFRMRRTESLRRRV